MKIGKIIPAVICGGAIVFSQGAQVFPQSGSLESASVSSSGLFKSVGSLHFKLPELSAPSARAMAKQTKTSGDVLLSGFVNIKGTAFLIQGYRFVTVFMSGSAALGDLSQVYTCGPISVSGAAHVAMGSGWVYATVPIRQTASVYRNGKLAGKTVIRGNVFVSGTSANHWVELSGTGALQADFNPNKS
ncbi:MAG: hypothetical protein ACYCPQ_04735 [Elusimicrobiota bacterium]